MNNTNHHTKTWALQQTAAVLDLVIYHILPRFKTSSWIQNWYIHIYLEYLPCMTDRKESLDEFNSFNSSGCQESFQFIPPSGHTVIKWPDICVSDFHCISSLIYTFYPVTSSVRGKPFLASPLNNFRKEKKKEKLFFFLQRHHSSSPTPL